jgi:hypothetical protein
VRVEKLAEQLDPVGQVIIAEYRGRDALDRADRVEERVRIEVVLRGAVGLVEIAVAARHLVEVDLLAVRQRGAAADGRGAVDAAERSRRGLGQGAGRAGRHVDRFGLLIGRGKQDAAAAAALPGEQVDRVVAAIAAPGDAAAAADADAIEIRAGHQIDDARHRVGAVDRRGTVLEHIGTGQRDGGDHVEIGRGVRAGPAGDEAAIVEQHQRALDAEAAQVDLCGTIAVPGPIGRGLVASEARIGGQALEQGLDIDDAGALDLLGGDYRGRPHAGNVLSADATAGHQDFVSILILRTGLVGRWLRVHGLPERGGGGGEESGGEK